VNTVIIKSLKPNHAVLTDLKLFIQIPFLKLEVSSDITGFLELITIFKKKPIPEAQKMKMFREFSQYGYGSKSDSFLLAEMKGLYHDHKTNSKACRHCVMKYRKSNLIVNLVFGDMLKEIRKVNEKSWFHFFDEYNFPISAKTGKEEAGKEEVKEKKDPR
jgi:hypothetical protein